METIKRYGAKKGYYRHQTVDGYYIWESNMFLFDQDLNEFVDSEGEVYHQITAEKPRANIKDLKLTANGRINMIADIKKLNELNDEFETLLVECLKLSKRKFQSFVDRRI